VEDESSIADNLVYALETEGFSPVVCQTGIEALRRMEEEAWALVILDVGLPDTNGFELYKQLKALRDCPVIFLTARGAEIDRVVGLELGADDYVVKPFSPRELGARVKAVLRRCTAPRRPAEERARGPFVIDGARCRISFYGRELELSRCEFRLLEVLLRNPGRVYSRTQLMERAWEEPEMSLERTVDAHVKSIRKKLRAANPDDDAIVTHRGLGYSMKEYK